MDKKQKENPVNIYFKNTLISKVPINILDDVYFYTPHYSFSVKQFTGKNQEYWKELPSRLRKVQNNQKGLSVIIEELEKLAEGDEGRLEKRRGQRHDREEKEKIINFQLISLLTALPRELCALVFKNITGQKDAPYLYNVVDLKLNSEQDGGEKKKGKKSFVEPDLLLLGNDTLLMVELKIKTSSCKYDAEQLLKYIHLVAKCQDSKNKDLPTTFLHLIIVPAVDEKLKWLKNHSTWVNNYDLTTRRLYVNPDKCIHYRDKDKYIKEHSPRICRLLNEIPIYYCSWDDLAKAYDKAISEFKDSHNEKHWVEIGKELRDLADRAIHGLKPKKE